MLVKLLESPDVLTKGLLSTIGLLLGAITYFLKKTYDKTYELDKKFIARDEKLTDMSILISSHKSNTYDVLISAKRDISTTLSEVQITAQEIREEVKTSVAHIAECQKEIIRQRKGLAISKDIHEVHQKKIVLMDSELKKIGKALYILKNKK